MTITSFRATAAMWLLLCAPGGVTADTLMIRTSYNNLGLYADSVSSFVQEAWSNVTILTTLDAIATYKDASTISWEDVYKQENSLLDNVGIAFVDSNPTSDLDCTFDEPVTIGQAVASQLDPDVYSTTQRSLLSQGVAYDALDSWYAHGNCLVESFCPENFALAVSAIGEKTSSTSTTPVLELHTTIVEMEISGIESVNPATIQTEKFTITIQKVHVIKGESSPDVLNSNLVLQIVDKVDTRTIPTPLELSGPTAAPENLSNVDILVCTSSNDDEGNGDGSGTGSGAGSGEENSENPSGAWGTSSSLLLLAAMSLIGTFIVM